MNEENNREWRDQISVGASSDFEDGDAALEALVQLKEIEFGEVFDERDTSIDSEDTEGISITFNNSEEGNRLEIYTMEDDHVHIVLQLYEDRIQESEIIFSEISKDIGGIKLQSVRSFTFKEMPFNKLSFPIQEDIDHNVSGIRITQEDANYIVQTIDDSGMIYINRDRRIDEEDKFGDASTLGESDFEAIDAFINQFR